MPTIRQLVMRNRRVSKYRKSRVPALEGCPHKIGTVRKVLIEKPKKPNSARRKVVKVELKNKSKQKHKTKKKLIKCHIPGIGHSLTRYSMVMIRGGRTQDLIGVRYKAIRNKLDLPGVVNRVSRRTKFGVLK